LFLADEGVQAFLAKKLGDDSKRKMLDGRRRRPR